MPNQSDELIERDELYGLMAEFRDEESFVEAIRQTRGEGYSRMDAYSPFPVDGAAEALDFRRTWVPPITLFAGIVGGMGGYMLQYWCMALAYPGLNIGGRPPNSWPYYIPITYEMVILFAAWLTLLGMFALNGLPRPYHPVFNVPAFARASQDRFFVAVEAADPRFDYDATRRFLERLSPGRVYDIPS